MPSYSRRIEIPGKTSEALYEKLSNEIDRFLDRGTFGGKAEITRDSVRKELRLKASLITATVICENECIQVNAQLSLLAAPFRSKIDDGISRWIEKTFGSKNSPSADSA